MNEKIQNTIKITKHFLSKHSPEILTGLGLASMATSTILAVKATPKAIRLIQYEENQNGKKIDVKGVIKTTWKEYIPAVSFGLGGMTCIICGCRIGTKRSAALATAYAISERTLRTYRDKVVETIGEKKEKDIRRKINQEDIEKNPPKNTQVFITNKGNTLIKDSLSGRYFRSDLDSIKKAVNDINRKMTYENYISLNEFYSAIGLDSVKDGDNIGWNLDNGLIELDYDTCLAENDEPCICIDYNSAPKPNYNKYF